MLLSRKRSREAPALHGHGHGLGHLQTPQQRAIDEKWFLRDLLDAFDDSRALEQSQRQILEFLQRHNQCLPAPTEPSAQAMELSRANLSSQELFLSVVLEWQRSADTAADALQVQPPQFLSSHSSSYESSSAESSRSESSSEEEEEEEQEHVRTRHSSRKAHHRSDEVSPTSVHSVPRDHLTPLSLDGYSSSAKMIGIYSPRARQELLRKYMTKRAKRLSQNTVRYRVRKTLANARPRVKGRFVKTEQPLTAALVEAMTK